MFKPCNYTLDRLAELTVENHQRAHENRRRGLQRGKLEPGFADYMDRYEAAVIEAVKKLQHIEQHHPHLLETSQ